MQELLKQLRADAKGAHDPLRGILRASGAITPGAISANDGTTGTVTVTGAALGDFVLFGYGADLNAGIILSAWVSAADTVTWQMRNVTSGSITPASSTIYFCVLPRAGANQVQAPAAWVCTNS